MARKKESRLTFGLIIDKLSSWAAEPYYQTDILFGVEDFAKENNINVLCFVTGAYNSNEGRERSRNILFNLVREYNLDGVIIIPATFFYTAREDEITELLHSFGSIPIVTINQGHNNLPFVCINNYTAMKEIIEHLIQTHGCRDIAFIRGLEGSWEADDRYKAYIDTLAEHNIPFKPELVYQGDFIYTSGNAAVNTFLDNHIHFDSIASSNDDMAIGVIDQLRNRFGYIPDHISITGFDDTLASKAYSLTTVKQSFYQQAKTISNILLKLIHGEHVDLKCEAPVEIVLRSSCGCSSTSVILGTTGVYPLASLPFSDNFQRNKESIITNLTRINKIVDKSIVSDLEEFEHQMLHAFYDEIALEQKHKFIRVWNKTIFWAIRNKVDFRLLQDILSSIRKLILSCFSKLEEVELAEDIFQQTRILIGEAIINNQSSIYYETTRLNYFDEELISNLNVDHQMNTIYASLPEFGINRCYISIYENLEKPLTFSKLILAFDAEKRSYKDEGHIFKTQRMLPDNVIQDLKKSRYSLVIQSLFHGEYPLGFAMFDFGTKTGMIYEYVRYRLSIALKSGLLFEKINVEAQNLEREVLERTKDLSRTNKLLETEISIRKTMEDQLKKALENLEVNNLELKDQSLRDALTGLYNRRGFILLGEQFYKYAKKMNKSFFIMYADLDGLKQINDMYGHLDGDHAIMQTAKILNNAFRGSDIVARFGGDEFVVLIDDPLPHSEEPIRKRLNNLFEIYNQTKSKPFLLSISMGMAFFNPESPIDFEGLMSKADKNLYHFKKLKKGL